MTRWRKFLCAIGWHAWQHEVRLGNFDFHHCEFCPAVMTMRPFIG